MTTREAPSERPIITFALFAYNQEQYIREAVESAFSQVYEPLEIILSDDLSSDRTFEIMQEMAAAYIGPHKIKVRQNEWNLGTAQHVQSVANLMSGALLVVAAGDDISVAGRVAALSSAWVDAGCPEGALHSGRESFRDGKTIATVPVKKSKYSDNVLEGYAHGYWLPAAAPTCAYTRGVFERFRPLMGGSIIEDAPLQLRAALIGKFIACNQILVRQRFHDANTGTGYAIDAPARWNRFIQSKIIAFRNMQIDLVSYKRDMEPEMSRRIESRILAVLRSTSGLLLPEDQRTSSIGRLRLAFKIITAPAVARSFRLRLEYALGFFGFDFHIRIKDRLRGLILEWKPS